MMKSRSIHEVRWRRIWKASGGDWLAVGPDLGMMTNVPPVKREAPSGRLEIALRAKSYERSRKLGINIGVAQPEHPKIR